MSKFTKTRLNLKENKIFIISVIILVFLISFTHLIGYWHADEDYDYVGNQPTRRRDMPGYFSFIIQAEEGHVLFKNLYNPVEQKALFFHPLWLAIGWSAKIFNLSTLLAYQLFKVILAIIFCLVLRKFLKNFYSLDRNKWLFPFCIFAGGFFTWLIEKDTFLNLYYNPLFILALILFILIIHSVLKYFKTHQNYLLLIIFIYSLLLFLVHFYDVIPLLAAIFAWTIYQYLTTGKFKSFKPVLFIVLAIMIGALYYYYIFSAEEALNRWAANNYTPLPSWHFLAIGYGFLSPLAVLGAIKKRKEKLYLLLIFWCASALFVTLSSLPFNRRLVLGLSIPLTILAYQGFKFIISKFKKNLWQITFALFIVLLLIHNNLFMIFLDLEVIRYHGRPQYLKRNYTETLSWMRDNLPKSRVIFANMRYWDTEISGYTGLISYWGGSYYSIFEENLDKIDWFFKDDELPSTKKQFLVDNNIDYLFFSDIEKRLGTFSPYGKDFLKLVYKNKDAHVYEVIY